MSDAELSDVELLLRLRVEPGVMGDIYRRHAVALHRYLARRVGEVAADDLLGDVFVAALDARTRVVPHVKGSALPWLYGIASNVVRAHRRRAARHGFAPGDFGMDWDAVDDRIDAQGQRAALSAVLAALSEGEREVLLLVAWECLTPVEAAEALGISRVAARSRLHRARVHAKETLTKLPDPMRVPLNLDLLDHEENLT